MRKTLWIISGLTALWCIWWAIVAFGLSKAVSNWFDGRHAMGWHAEYADTAIRGFPNRVTYSIEDIQLYDPRTAVGLSLPELEIDVSAFWPGNAQLRLADAPIDLTTSRQALTITASQAHASLNLHPGTALQLEALSTHSNPFKIKDRHGQALYSGQSLLMSFAQAPEDQTRYAWKFDAQDFAPGDQLRTQLDLPPSWPSVFETFAGHITINFDRPLELNNPEARPQPKHIEISQLEAHWGEMRILATGQLDQDMRGYAAGSLSIKAENWPQLLDFTIAIGLVSQEAKAHMSNILSALAQGSGQTDDLDIRLTFEDGRTKIGVFPLGPAPRLVIR
jgi:hypothetical protein